MPPLLLEEDELPPDEELLDEELELELELVLPPEELLLELLLELPEEELLEEVLPPDDDEELELELEPDDELPDELDEELPLGGDGFSPVLPQAASSMVRPSSAASAACCRTGCIFMVVVSPGQCLKSFLKALSPDHTT